MKIAKLLGAVWLVTGHLPAQEIPRARELLDPTAVVPEEEVPAVEFQPPVIDPGVDLSDRVFSHTRQFVVSGGDPAQRGTIAVAAERIRGSLLALLGLDKEEVVFPIEIILHGKPGDPPRRRPVALELRFTPETFLIRIHLDVSRGIDHEKMGRAVLTALIDQRSLKGIDPAGFEGRVLAPMWLVDGLLEADLWQSGRADRKLYEGVFDRDGLFTVDQLLSLAEDQHELLDGASRAAFRALSGAMVMALLEQPQGREGFRAFTAEVARYDGELPILLRQHFPDLNLSEQSLAKWWALTLAKLADAPLTEVLGIAATEEALADALTLHYRDAEGRTHQQPFENWELIEGLDEAARLEAIRPAQDSLYRLSYRCFPSYRPLLVDYQKALQDWAADRRIKKLAILLGELAETREIMMTRADRARDYLNWMEINAAQQLSGSFDDFVRLKEELKERPRAERSDPVSRYLDTLESVHDRGRLRK